MVAFNAPKRLRVYSSTVRRGEREPWKCLGGMGQEIEMVIYAEARVEQGTTFSLLML